MRQNELIVRLKALRYDIDKLTEDFGLVDGDYHSETLSEALYILMNLDK
tara:strand:+ start:204 stop:350 length:147 start_codon:yes stop_codon:yes gene_type:complete